MPSLREALDAAREFLAPALKRGNDDVVVRLSNNIGVSSTSDAHRAVLRAALGHLLRIHEADITQQNQAPPANGEGEYDEDSRQTLYGLLDLVAIRGILPSLSPGVAANRRPRSTIPGLSDATPGSNKDSDLLCGIVDGMGEMLGNPGAGLASLIRERVLVDVTAGAGELAFSPDSSDVMHQKYGDTFVLIINKTPIASALPLLTYLMQPTTPPWLKSQLSKQLALAPLRPRGVRHTIEFIASSYPQPPQSSDNQDRTTGPSLPLEALVQASKLLSSVPSSMDAEAYFTALAPQLLTMLDGAEGQELAKAAALVIGSGILGKKALGAPGAIGWRLFAEPIIFSISPPKVQTVKAEVSSTSLPDAAQTVVAEPELRRALSRLVTLVTSRPSPGLTKRLLGRLMLPLWALLGYAKSHPVGQVWKDIPWQLLEAFFRLSAGVEQLEALASNLLWDGPPAWTFAPGSDGGIEIRRRERTPDDDAFNVIAQMGSLEERLATYQELLTSNCVEDQDIGDLFVRLSRRWLVPHSIQAGGAPKLEAPAEEDPFQSLITAKLVMAILEKFRDKLATRPENMIELVKQLLDEWTESEKARKQRAENLQKPSYTGLRNIVQQSQKRDEGAEQQLTSAAEVGSSEILPVALSLLNTLLSTPNFRPTPQTSSTLSTILPTLSDLHDRGPGSELPPSVSMTASTLTTRITTLLNIPAPSKPNNPRTSPSTTTTATATATATAADQAALQTALKDLTSPDPPLRASALSAISALARARSPALDLPQLTLLLLSTSLPDPDEYVHLHVIQTLAALASLDPQLVAGHLLVRAFADVDESSSSSSGNDENANGLDARLRVGEVLGRVVSDMQEASPPPPSLTTRAATAAVQAVVIRQIATACLRIASRRGARASALRARQRAARLAERKRRAAEKAWGGPVPQILAPEEGGGDEDAAAERDAALLSSVVSGWSDTGLDEDVRLRALALSVFTTVVREPATLAVLPRADVAAGVDVVLGSLALETEERHAVLRRAAVLVVWGLVGAMDKELESGGRGGAVGEGEGVGAVLTPEKWEEVGEVVGWVRDRDADAVVKGHAGEVLEALETWRVKRALGVRGDGSAVAAGAGVRLTKDLGLAELRGLSVNADGSSGESRGMKPVVEEIE
ncbi:protein required for cell viability [Diplodia corticola]|uniref:Protein required for cell viability n=1 Tax=Diplodia corticola TaxID=236234 RepID=A0A1J9RC16_9PEZI|nr:protein required for cell viability [Diplodia corticola]OJD37706.1 protein required for cell viability [Diplodia corticola]